MASGKDVADECGYYYEEEKNHTNVSCFHEKVGAVVKASPDVEINANEEEGGAVCM